MTARRISFVLAILGAGVLAAQGTVVARGEGFVLGADEVMAAWAAAPREVRASLCLKDDGIQEFFLEYLRVALLADEARVTGLDRDPVIQERIAAATRAVLGQAYLERSVREPLLTDEALWRQYDRIRNEYLREGWYEARHILVTPKPTPELNNRRWDDAAGPAEAKKKIQRIQKLLASGTPFEEAARDFSEDPATCPAGGNLGRFKRGVMEATVEEALDRLEPGAISGVVESSYGFHLLQLVAIQRPGPLPFERMRPLLEQRVIGAEAGVLVRQEMEQYEELKRRRGLNVNWEAVWALQVSP